MRKHSVRKWLHAILDLLPLFVIPIFALAVRSDNNFQPISIITNESYWEVESKYDTNEVNTINDLQLNKIYHSNELNIYYDNYEFDILIFSYTNTSILDFEQLYVDENNLYDEYNANYENCLSVYVRDETIVSWTNLNSYAMCVFGDFNITFYDCNFVISDNINGFKNFINSNQTNSITKSDFKVLEYNYHENEPITYNDTDVGSQMVYTLYNTVDKYFNMNNVFNMGQIWKWVNNNMFGGSAPLSAYIVYQIIAYELIMDIIFLLYSVMMFIVDFAEKGIDRFLGRSC